jgi:tubulin epsilon
MPLTLTLLRRLLEDEFPDVYRFTCSVFPSEDDDVITSPYNAMLSLAELTEHADCVLPIENASLSDICGRIADRFAKQPSKQGSSLSGMDAGQGCAPSSPESVHATRRCWLRSSLYTW